MKCKHSKALSDAGFCKIASRYCTYTQETTCKQKSEIIATNADRIRGMNDEELAREMLFFVPSDFKKHYTGLSGGYFATADEAIQASLDWPRQPAKEEHRATD